MCSRRRRLARSVLRSMMTWPKGLSKGGTTRSFGEVEHFLKFFLYFFHQLTIPIIVFIVLSFFRCFVICLQLVVGYHKRKLFLFCSYCRKEGPMSQNLEKYVLIGGSKCPYSDSEGPMLLMFCFNVANFRVSMSLP